MRIQKCCSLFDCIPIAKEQVKWTKKICNVRILFTISLAPNTPDCPTDITYYIFFVSRLLLGISVPYVLHGIRFEAIIISLRIESSGFYMYWNAMASICVYIHRFRIDSFFKDA